MIAPLRRWHRRAAAGLAVAVPVLVVAAIAARPDVPVNPALPSAGSAREIRSTTQLAWSRPGIDATLNITGEGAAEVSIDAGSLSTEPHVLLYLLEPADTQDPPRAGRLLGSVRGSGSQSFPLPADSTRQGGRLALYSLAHDEVVATADIPAQGGRQ